VPPVFQFPLTSAYEVTVPFTATGHLNVGDGYELVGSGLLHFEYCPGACGGLVNPTASYIFATPEPSTLLLGSVALTMAVLARVRHLRRGTHVQPTTGHHRGHESVIG
jgi:hypothetical protein